jgi:hypothetical protein
MKAPAALLSGMALEALEKLRVAPAAAMPATSDCKTNRLDNVSVTSAPIFIS